MASTADFRNGMCIHFKGELYFIVKFQHVKPGKGPAFVRTDLKNVKTGRVIDHTFSAGAKVEEARIERRTYQFLYHDNMGYHLMNLQTYNQITIQKELIDVPDLLKDGENIDVVFHADTETPLYAELPPSVILKVAYTEPGFRGDTASSNAQKTAKLETGVEIMVPLFINSGDLLKINTATKSYSERVKK